MRTPRRLNPPRRFAAVALSLAAIVTARADAQAPDTPRDQPAELLRTDSRTPYVHRLTLYDHAGTAISPADEPAAPYSPQATCAKCHEYGLISSGWHFSAGSAGASDGRPGEPWIYTDAATGTQLPLSLRAWPGTFRPREVGISDWQFLLNFGRHLPGGGLLEQPDAQQPDASRFDVSGRAEIDCMICHADGGSAYDAAENERQLQRQNVRWMPTLALGLAALRGDAARLPDDFDPLAPSNPDRPDLAAPRLQYDPRHFDADDRVHFDITRQVSAERCYFCHSARQVGPGAAAAWEEDGDVHLRAGLSCVDCHRHGIAHDMVRGYEGELGSNPLAAALSCRGCHLGDESAREITTALGGRLRAPAPAHAGIPPIHFRKLSCTACHSGPWPDTHPLRLQTSFSHGLGVPTRERRADAPPHIVGPIFARDADDFIRVYRLLWPAYWGALHEERVTPLTLEQLRPLTAALREADLTTTRAVDLEDALPGALRPAQIERGLRALRETGRGDAVYVADGKLHALNAGGVVTREHPTAQPYRWALAHDVRPAAQSLGVRGCTDCHDSHAPLFFGRTAALDQGASASPQAMHELVRYDAALAGWFASGLRMKTALLTFGLTCAGLILLFVLHRGLAGTIAALLGALRPRQ